MKHITLWIPAPDQPCWECIIPLWNLETPRGYKLRLYRSGANNIRYSWNKAVLDFLDTDDEWLLSVHNDVMVCPKTLTRLLSWNKPLISALIFMRVGQALPHVWKSYRNEGGRMAMRISDTRQWFYSHPQYMTQTGPFVMEPKPKDALSLVDFTSTSCTLIHRSVIEKMRPLVKDIWFQWDDDYAGGGEDRRFFQYAKRAGFMGYVDRSCVVGHLARTVPTSAYDFVAWDSATVFLNTGEPEMAKLEADWQKYHAVEAEKDNGA